MNIKRFQRQEPLIHNKDDNMQLLNLYLEKILFRQLHRMTFLVQNVNGEYRQASNLI